MWLRAVAIPATLVCSCGLSVVGQESASEDGGAGACEAGPCVGSPVELVTLSVTVSGSAMGARVTSPSFELSCPPECALRAPRGSNVTLVATVPVDEALVSWSGSCLGRDTSCSVNMDVSKEVGVSFAPLQHYVHSASELYQVVGDTGATKSMGSFSSCSGTNMGDIAIDRSGAAYAITLPPSSGNGTLYKVDLATAACAAPSIGALGKRCNGLTFAPDPADPSKDVLFAACATELARVDTTTGAATAVGSFGGGTSSGDLVWVPDHGVFLTLSAAGKNDALARVDLSTGNATVVSSDLGIAKVYALGWRDGQILGYADGTSFRVDPATGAKTPWNAATGVSAFGAASGP